MWQLMMTNAANAWVEAGVFETMLGVAARICDLENHRVHGLFLRAPADPYGRDDEALAHLEYRGLSHSVGHQAPCQLTVTTFPRNPESRLSGHR
jgi:hypothetical protein